MSIPAITPKELYPVLTKAQAKGTLVDVRELDEYHERRCELGLHCALSDLSQGQLGPLAKLDKDERLYLLCRSGMRSQKAGLLLQQLGFSDVVNVTGGILAWQAAGLPTTSGG